MENAQEIIVLLKVFRLCYQISYLMSLVIVEHVPPGMTWVISLFELKRLVKEAKDVRVCLRLLFIRPLMIMQAWRKRLRECAYLNRLDRNDFLFGINLGRRVCLPIRERVGLRRLESNRKRCYWNY